MANQELRVEVTKILFEATDAELERLEKLGVSEHDAVTVVSFVLLDLFASLTAVGLPHKTPEEIGDKVKQLVTNLVREEREFVPQESMH